MPRSSVGALFAFKIPAAFEGAASFFLARTEKLFKRDHLRLMTPCLRVWQKKEKLLIQSRVSGQFIDQWFSNITNQLHI